MLSERLAAALARRGIHYGWVVAVLGFLTLLTTAGAMGLPGAFILPLHDEFGWSTAQISSALSIRLLLFGLIAPFAAAMMNRYGLRLTIAVAAVLICGGLFAAQFMTAFWQLMVLWGVVIGIGTGMTALVLGATIANRWFVKHRGLVIGCLTASNATGQLIFLPIAAWLVTHVGWRAALVPSTLALFAVALLDFLFLSERPSNLGILAYGESPGPTPAPALPPSSNPFLAALSVLGEGMRQPAFWALFATFFICGLSTNGLIQTHFIAFCHDYGLEAVTAASVLAMMGMFDIVGTIGSGYLSDRFDARWLLFCYYGLRGLSLLWLPSSSFTLYGLSIFALFYGLDWVATVPPTLKITSAVFGREKAAMIFGWVFMGHQLGAAVAALGGGLSRTEFATYLPAFYAAGAFCLLAALISLAARPKRPDERGTTPLAWAQTEPSST